MARSTSRREKTRGTCSLGSLRKRRHDAEEVFRTRSGGCVRCFVQANRIKRRSVARLSPTRDDRPLAPPGSGRSVPDVAAQPPMTALATERSIKGGRHDRLFTTHCGYSDVRFRQ
jgi:hypothetical protein